MSKSATQRAGHVERAGTTAVQRTRGRPSLYSPQMVADACFLAKQGFTDVEIAAELGIAVSTFYLLSSQHREFSEALRAGKDEADDRMELSLYRRGIGYAQRTQKLHQGNVVSIMEHVPGDVGAQTLWLTNRRRDKWRKNTDVSIVVPETVELTEDQASDRQLALAAIALLTETAIAQDEDQNTASVIDMELQEENEDAEPDATERPADSAPARQRRSRRHDPASDFDFE